MKNKFIVLLILIFTSFYLPGQDLLKKYLDEAKGFYIIKDYKNAYSRIKFALRIYKTESEIPKEVTSLAESIYYDYINELFQKNDENILNDIFKNDPRYTYVLRNSNRLQTIIGKYEEDIKAKKLEEEILKKTEEEKKRNEELEKIKKTKEEELEKLRIAKEEEYEKLKKLKEEQYQKEIESIRVKYDKMISAGIKENQNREEEIKKIRDKEREELIKLQERYEKERIDFYEKSKDDLNKFVNNVLLTINKNSSDTIKLIIYVVILLVIVFGIVFLSIVIINVFFLRSSHQQQQRYFEYTIRAIQQNPSNLLSIPMTVPNIETGNLIETPAVKKLTGPSEQQDQNMERIAKVIESCNPYAKEIDAATHRKNCSKNVAELVYKISKHLGYNEFDSMLYYAVGLIYDIGFLNIDPTIMEKPEISEKEYEIIKTHTTLGTNMIHFIDNDLKPTFTEGILKHHENLDGSGYPKGATKNDIPYIARALRVVESFISLISKREYKEITDKVQAIADLYKSKSKYDKKIIDALNEII